MSSDENICSSGSGFVVFFFFKGLGCYVIFLLSKACPRPGAGKVLQKKKVIEVDIRTM